MEARKTNGTGFTTAKWPLDPDRATLVFIHGSGGTGAFWQAQIEALAPSANTIAVDLPGHGTSDGPALDDIEDLARAVAVLVGDIEAPQPIPCGLSLGGAIAQQLLLDTPEIFKAGILISTGSRLRVAKEIFDAIEKDFNGYVDMITKLVVSKATDPKRVTRFREDTANCHPEVILADFRACDRFDVMQRIASIGVPVLVLTAEDDQVTPPKYGDFLKNAIPHASRTHIRNAGHIVPLEQPEQVNQAIEAFLEGLDLEL